MAGKYATKTEVTVEKSRADIEAVLMRYGADAFAYSVDGRQVTLGFRMSGRHFRFRLTMPDPADKDLTTYTQAGYRKPRTETAAKGLWEQACRSTWRALLLVIKVKLEAVAAGISTLEDEFMANLLLPDRSTVSEFMRPQIEEAYRVGLMPKRLQLEGPRDG